MGIKIVSSTEFRNNQKFFFDQSKKNGVVYVMNNGNVYSLRPTTELEVYYANPKVQEDLTKGLLEIENGESYTAKPEESLDEFLARMRAEGNV